MSHTLDVQVLSDDEPYASTSVRISIGHTFAPGGRMGLFGDDAWTDDDGHATFQIPEYDDYSDKYVNFQIGGKWFGSWDLVEGDCAYTVDVDKDDEAADDDDD